MFAVAGAIAAAGPLVIHLLNRRRYRIVHWAAMDFLREAINRNRKILQLRDILLLILRTAAVLLFGFALARPFFARSGGDKVEPGTPLHAILVVDNSMSMSYRQGSDSLLDEAKSRGRELIEALPEGSRMTVLPLCGGGTFSRDAYRTKKDAIDALERVEIVDRAGTAARAADLAREGMAQAIDVPDNAKRIIFLSDQQIQDWKGASPESILKGLPEMQVVDVSAHNPENSWISDFHLLDGMADASKPARFIARVTHQGHEPRPNVKVTLWIDGAEAQSKVIDLNADQTAEVTFEYLFNDPPEPGGVRWSTAKVSLPPDALQIDDSRFLAVPVVSALPVVFVDQYGESEDPQRNRIGETRHFRGLLNPQTVRGQEQLHLVKVVQRRMDQLEQHDLRDARLVVIAGVARPESADGIRLLRDYVRQGGQLVIAAGADFDPAAWTEQAWLDGGGILPLPLEPQPLGRTPEEVGNNPASGDFKVFSLKIAPSDVSSNAYFQLPQTEPQEIVDSLREPTFFKAVVPREDKAAVDRMVAAEAKRIEARRTQLTDIDAEIQKLSEKQLHDQLNAADQASLDRLQRNRNEISPSWLLFDSQRDVVAADTPATELAERSRPKVELRFDNQVPFLVEREIGRGRVVMFTTGFFSDWNDFPRKGAFWLVDRILRSRIESTLPIRNVDTSAAPIMVNVQPSELKQSFVLVRPGTGSELGVAEAQKKGLLQPLEVERHGRDNFVVAVADFAQRGIYRVANVDKNSDQESADSAGKTANDGAGENKEAQGADGKTAADGTPASGGKVVWEAVIAANGPADESKLASIDERGLAERMSGAADAATPDSGAAASSDAARAASVGGPTPAARYQWIPRGQPISLTGAEIWGQDTWWWLLLTVLVCLLLELTILAWPTVSQSAAPARETA
jgi:hypothetical protein